MGEERYDAAEYPHQEITKQVIGAAMEVHGILGPGYSEPVYQEALEREMTERKLEFASQPPLEIWYKGIRLRKKFRPDFLVESATIVEIKAGTALTQADQGQILNYLKASHLVVGLLLNFGTLSLPVKRVVHSQE